MRVTGLIVCLFLPLVVGGCNVCLDGFRALQVGQLLPDQSPPGLCRSGVGVGGLDFGWTFFPLSAWDRSVHVLADESGRVLAKEYYSCSVADVPPVCFAFDERTILEVQVPAEWWRDPAEGWQDRVIRCLSAGQGIRDLFKGKSDAEQHKLVRLWQAWVAGRLRDPTAFYDAMELSAETRKAMWASDVIGRAPKTQQAKLMFEFDAWVGDRLTYTREFLRRLGRLDAQQKAEATGPPEPAQRDVMLFIELVEQLVEIVPLVEGTVDRPDNPGIAGRGVMHELRHWDWYSDDGEPLDLRGVTKEGFDWQGTAPAIRVRVRNLGGRRIRIEHIRKWAQGHMLWPLMYGQMVQDLSREFSRPKRPAPPPGSPNEGPTSKPE